MPDVNIVILAGRLTRDPEMRYMPNGTAVAKLSMAIGHKYKDGQGQVREEVTFVDVEVFGRQVETSSQYLAKGHGLLVEGGLRLDQWEDKASGQKRSKLKVNGHRIQFMGAPKGERQGASAADQRRQKQDPKDRTTEAALDVEDDGIPF
jgi:single-strand DNA-binding protein